MKSPLRALALGFLLLPWNLPSGHAETIIDNEDGTYTHVENDGRWELRDAQGRVLDRGREDTGHGSHSEEPGFDGFEAVSTAPTPEPIETCTAVETECSPEDFRQSGSKYFSLHYCPGACGESAFRRVQEVIDPAWDFVSARFGSLYDTSRMRGYVYTTHSHYSDQSGAVPWSGGFFSPSRNQVHVPAPLGRRGFALESLLVHELTHFRLHKLTHSAGVGGGAIRYFRFLNEGLAQQMEQRLYEERQPRDVRSSERRRALRTLKRHLEAGRSFLPLKKMMWGVRGSVSFYYAQSWATVAYIEARHGERAMDALLEEIGRTPRKVRTYPQLEKLLEGVLQSALRTDAETLRSASEAWTRDQIRAEFGVTG